MGKGAKTKGYVQNLKTNKMIKFLYNPEGFEYGYSAEYAVIKAPGSPHPVYQFVGGNERTLTTTLLIDCRETGYEKFKQYTDFFGQWHPVNSGVNTFNPSPPALFGMGWFIKKVIIKELNWRFLLFDKDLNPIRAELDLTMETIMEG